MTGLQLANAQRFQFFFPNLGTCMWHIKKFPRESSYKLRPVICRYYTGLMDPNYLTTLLRKLYTTFIPVNPAKLIVLAEQLYVVLCNSPIIYLSANDTVL